MLYVLAVAWSLNTYNVSVCVCAFVQDDIQTMCIYRTY